MIRLGISLEREFDSHEVGASIFLVFRGDPLCHGGDDLHYLC